MRNEVQLRWRQNAAAIQRSWVALTRLGRAPTTCNAMEQVIDVLLYDMSRVASILMLQTTQEVVVRAGSVIHEPLEAVNVYGDAARKGRILFISCGIMLGQGSETACAMLTTRLGGLWPFLVVRRPDCDIDSLTRRPQPVLPGDLELDDPETLACRVVAKVLDQQSAAESRELDGVCCASSRTRRFLVKCIAHQSECEHCRMSLMGPRVSIE